MKYVLWGIGNRGKVIFEYLKGEVCAIIEGNSALIGQKYENVPIIDFETYKTDYKDTILIISPFEDDEIVDIVSKNKIPFYFLSNDCPSDFVENYNPEIIDELLKKVDKNRRQIVFGFSLFSVLLSIELKKTCSRVCMCIENDQEYEKVNSFIYNIDCDIDVCTIAEFGDFSNSNIFYASKRKIRSDLFCGKDTRVIESFFVFELLNKYHNDSICRFKGIHKGKRCFIVATGPSVRVEDLERLKERKEICISMNKIFYCFDRTSWRPDYYVGEDKNLLEYYREELIEYIDIPAFISDHQKEGQSWPSNYCTVHVSTDQPNSRYYGCNDFAEGYVCGYSVIFGCIYLAVYMGFKEINIIGADFNYQADMTSSQNHFYGSKDTKSANRPFYYDKVIKSYEHVKQYCEENGVQILNATRGGNLEVLERKELDSVLSDQIRI